MASTPSASPAHAAAAAGSLHSAHLFISGKVQGVFYRKYTQRAGTDLGVTGWVRNLPDGRVELWAEGTLTQLETLRQWCFTGSPKSKVTEVAVATAPTGAKAKEGGAAGSVPAEPFPAITKRQYMSFDVVK